jgi:hypothetical protein
MVTWPPLQMRGFEHRTAQPAGGDGWRGEQGDYGLHGQSAGPRPNVWFCLFLTNGAMRKGKIGCSTSETKRLEANVRTYRDANDPA